jgi:hypothetical protein
MTDDRERVTVRLPQNAYEKLCTELSSFSTDTARFQFVAQFYLDYKEQRDLPGSPSPCTDTHGESDGTNVTHNETSGDQPAENQSGGREPPQSDGSHYQQVSTPERARKKQTTDHHLDNQ